MISITEKFNNSEAVIIFFSICLLTLGFCSLFVDPHAKCYFATTEGLENNDGVISNDEFVGQKEKLLRQLSAL